MALAFGLAEYLYTGVQWWEKRNKLESNSELCEHTNTVGDDCNQTAVILSDQSPIPGGCNERGSQSDTHARVGDVDA